MTKIVNLKTHDLVFTTSFLNKLGVSGHLYEMIDYFYLCSKNGLNCAILLADGLDKDTFMQALLIKYDFSKQELELFESNVYECEHPVILIVKNLCVADGSWRMRECTVYADNVFLLRCSESDFSPWANSKSVKRAHIMQDYKLYCDRFENLNVSVVDYVKKILWSKYKKPKSVVTNTGLFYLTSLCRAIPVSDVQKIINKGYCKKYLIITDRPEEYKSLISDTVAVEKVPVHNIFERFDTYIYTSTKWQSDCSPRFIVECAVFEKEVIYEIDYLCPGTQRRREHIAEDLAGLELTDSDHFLSYVKENI